MIDLTQYRRRATHEVRIGACTIGGTHPVAVQSMSNTDTRDTAACVAQIERIARAGAPIVRLTAQGVREAENLRDITERLRADGNTTALVADIHFLPEAAAVAAQYVDKVRINPGNYRLDRGELEALVARCREPGASRCASASTTARSRSASSTSGATRPKGWWPQPWSFCTSAAARRSTRWSSR